MTTASATINFVQATDAEFRTWVAAIHTQLVAVGLVQTADTGQINTATVLAPTAANQNRGYSMWKPNDALTDWFLKLEFGSWSVGALNPMMKWSIGWATDGAGTFTGLQKSSLAHMAITGSNNGITAAECWFCFSGSAFAMVLNQTKLGTNGMNHALMIDRYRDADGTPNADGVTISSCADSNGGYIFVDGANPASRTFQHSVPATGGVPAREAMDFMLAGVLNRGTTWGRAGLIGLLPIHGWDGGPTPAMISGVQYLTIDVTNGTIFKCSLYGTEHTFRAAHVITSVGGAVPRLAILWE